MLPSHMPYIGLLDDAQCEASHLFYDDRRVADGMPPKVPAYARTYVTPHRRAARP